MIIHSSERVLGLEDVSSSGASRALQCPVLVTIERQTFLALSSRDAENRSWVGYLVLRNEGQIEPGALKYVLAARGAVSLRPLITSGMIGRGCIGVMNGETTRQVDGTSVLLFSAFFRSLNNAFTSRLGMARIAPNRENRLQVLELSFLDSVNHHLLTHDGYGFLTTPHFESESGYLWLTAGSGTEFGFPSSYGVIGAKIHELSPNAIVEGPINKDIAEAFMFSTKPTSRSVNGSVHRYVSVRDRVGDYSLVRVDGCKMSTVDLQAESKYPTGVAYPHVFGNDGEGILFSGGGWGAEGVFVGRVD